MAAQHKIDRLEKDIRYLVETVNNLTAENHQLKELLKHAGALQRQERKDYRNASTV